MSPLQNAFENLAVESKQDDQITELQSIVALLGDLDLNTDGLEAAILALQAVLEDVDLNTDDLETLVMATNDDLANILSELEGVNAALSGTITVDGSITVDNPGLTDTELRAAPVDVEGPLTDTELRAAPVEVSDGGGSLTVDGTVTADAGAGPWPVTDNGGSLTVDGSVSVSNFPATQPVSGTVTANAGTGPWPVTDNGGSLTVDGPLTDTELRAAGVVILPPTGAPTTASQIVGTSSVQMPNMACAARKLILTARLTNPGIMYFGSANTVTAANSGNAGFELAPGDSIELEATNANQWYAIATNASNYVGIVAR